MEITKNAVTGETIYTPPQYFDAIMVLMSNLEQYINDSEIQDCDPLIKMAVLHYQFDLQYGAGKQSFSCYELSLRKLSTFASFLRPST